MWCKLLCEVFVACRYVYALKSVSDIVQFGPLKLSKSLMKVKICSFTTTENIINEIEKNY